MDKAISLLLQRLTGLAHAAGRPETCSPAAHAALRHCRSTCLSRQDSHRSAGIFGLGRPDCRARNLVVSGAAGLRRRHHVRAGKACHESAAGAYFMYSVRHRRRALFACHGLGRRRREHRPFHHPRGRASAMQPSNARNWVFLWPQCLSHCTAGVSRAPFRENRQ